MYKWLFNLLLLSMVSLLIACTPANNNEGSAPSGDEQANTVVPVTGSEYPNGQLLVEVDWVASHLEDPEVRILDIRDSADYTQGHIPGAHHVSLNAIVSTVNGIPFEFDEEGVQQALSQAGISPDMTVVIYDDLGMMNAARLFWTLEYVGHADVRVLNGGWNAWVATGGEQSVSAPALEESALEKSALEGSGYPLRLESDKLVSADELLGLLDDPNVTIVDSRSPQEYSGEVRLADRGGHIPGAVNLVWLDVLEGGDTVYTIEPDWQEQLKDEDVERLKSAEEIQAMLEERNITPDHEVITYCQTLWRGAHTYYVLRLMGFDQVGGYDGSWAEWGNREDLPIVEGSEPGG